MRMMMMLFSYMALMAMTESSLDPVDPLEMDVASDERRVYASFGYESCRWRYEWLSSVGISEPLNDDGGIASAEIVKA